MKRIGSPSPAPFVIQHDGTLLDRATRERVGRVYVDRLRGWMADNDMSEFVGHGSRNRAAQRAWNDWAARVR